MSNTSLTLIDEPPTVARESGNDADIDRSADIKVIAGWEPATAEIPLGGHASERWLELLRMLAKSSGPAGLEVNDRDDRTRVIVRLPQGGPARNPDPESALNAASALITQVNGMEQKSQLGAAQTEAAVRGWWARQQR